MGKIIQIEVPDWVKVEDVEVLKKMLIEALEEKMKDKTDINVYRMYFALKYPKTELKSFDLKEELKILEKMRKKEKERLIE